jgi:mono/diheme cytochrome c family protein
MKTLNSIYKTVLGLFIVALFASCEKEYVPAPVAKNVSYSAEMQPFFDANCVSCHNGTGIPLNLEASVSYDAIHDGGYIDGTTPANSKLYTKIIPGGSMETYATTTERSMTLVWIEEGAKNN